MNRQTLKTYHAYTMAEALTAVRESLGEDAVILNTRSFKRGGFLGLGRRNIVEVTATPAEAPPPSVPRRADPRAASAHKAYRAPSPPIERAATADSSAVMELVNRMLSEKSPPPRLEPVAVPASVPPPDAPGDGAGERLRPVAQRFLLKAEDRERFQALPPDAPLDSAPEDSLADAFDAASPPPAPAPSLEREAPAAQRESVQAELTAIREMLGQVLQRQVTGRAAPGPSLSGALLGLYRRLIDQELAPDLVEELVQAVRLELNEADLEDESRVHAAAIEQLTLRLPIGERRDAPDRSAGQPLIVALVGPTGVGKTTTLAKVAARYKLQQGRRVGLITADTYRIAAVDQLRTYANIIDLPLHVVLTPAEMRSAVHQLRACDVILIDTAGRSQKDPDRIAELGAFVRAADPHEVHLVLSSTAGERVLQQEVDAFSAVGVDRIALTKLDEAVSFGALLNVIRQLDKPVSYFTTGQEVPDHLEVGDAHRLAALILGEAVRT